MVNKALGVDDAVQAAQGIEAALLEGRQTRGGTAIGARKDGQARALNMSTREG